MEGFTHAVCEQQHLLTLPRTSASLTPNAAYLHIYCTQSFFRAELFFRTFKQLFLFKINHIKSALQNSSAPRQLLQGLLHINCFKSTKDPVLVPLNDLHECTWKPNSSKFSRGKNPCQTTLQPNDREDAAGRLAAQAGTQTGKYFWLKLVGPFEPHSFLQPAIVTAQFEIAQCPTVPQHRPWCWILATPLFLVNLPFLIQYSQHHPEGWTKDMPTKLHVLPSVYCPPKRQRQLTDNCDYSWPLNASLETTACFTSRKTTFKNWICFLKVSVHLNWNLTHCVGKH